MERDNYKFPATSYKDVVLEPLFESFKEHFYQQLMAINYAHTVMLAEQNIITLLLSGKLKRLFGACMK